VFSALPVITPMLPTTLRFALIVQPLAVDSSNDATVMFPPAFTLALPLPAPSAGPIREFTLLSSLARMSVTVPPARLI
jgi:hypothetical protein